MGTSPATPQSPYPQPDSVISNYILPHPPNLPGSPYAQTTFSSERESTFLHLPTDYVYDEPESPQESDEELENFIEKIYYNRRLF